MLDPAQGKGPTQPAFSKGSAENSAVGRSAGGLKAGYKGESPGGGGRIAAALGQGGADPALEVEPGTHRAGNGLVAAVGPGQVAGNAQQGVGHQED